VKLMDLPSQEAVVGVSLVREKEEED
jgi:hypothetical protein